MQGRAGGGLHVAGAKAPVDDFQNEIEAGVAVDGGGLAPGGFE
jgi:hypothetical protein